MNRIFKVIWNKVLGRKVVASELAHNNQIVSSAINGSDRQSSSFSIARTALFYALCTAGLMGSPLFATDISPEQLSQSVDAVVAEYGKRFAERGGLNIKPSLHLQSPNREIVSTVEDNTFIGAMPSLLASPSSDLIMPRAVYTYQTKYDTSQGTIKGTVGLNTLNLSNDVMKNPKQLTTGSNNYKYVTFLFRPEFESENSLKDNYAFFVYNSPVDTALILYDGGFDPKAPGYGALVGNDDAGNTFKPLFNTYDGSVQCFDVNKCPGVKYTVNNGDVYTVWVSTFTPGPNVGENKIIVGTNAKGLDGKAGSFSDGNLRDIDRVGEADDSFDLDFKIRPVFKGGTLRIYKPESLGLAAKEFTQTQRFTLSSDKTNTIDTNGKLVTFRGAFMDQEGQKGVITLVNNADNPSNVIFTSESTFTGGITIGNKVNVSLENGIRVEDGKSSDAKLGTGYINIANGGSLTVQKKDDYTLNNDLKGEGTISILLNTPSGSLVINEGKANDFQGTLILDKGTLKGDSWAHLTNAGTVLSLKSDGHLTSGKQNINSQLQFDGGELKIESLDSSEWPIKVGALEVTEKGGTVTATLDNAFFKGKDDNFILQSQEGSLQYVVVSNKPVDISHKGKLKSIVELSSTVTNNDGVVELKKLDNGYGTTDLTAYYDFSGNQLELDEKGIGQKVKLLKLVSASDALLSSKSLEGEQVMAAELAGVGGFTFEANDAGLRLSKQNSYQGETKITSGKLIISANNQLGQSGKVTIKQKASLLLEQLSDNQFNRELTGQGSLVVQGKGEAFSFGENVGSGFSGTFALNNLKLSVKEGNNGAVNANSNVILDQSTHLTMDGDLSANQFELKEGTISFNGALAKEANEKPVADGVLTVDQFTVGSNGKINITLDGYGQGNEPPPGNPIDNGATLSAEDVFLGGAGKKHTLTLVNANNPVNIAKGTIVLNGKTVTLENPEEVTESRVFYQMQNGEKNKIGTVEYGEFVSTQKGNASGLFVTSGLHSIIIDQDRTLDIAATQNNTDLSFTLLLKGEGSVSLSAKNGNAPLQFGNSGNEYKGETTLVDGKIQLIAEDGFSEGALTLQKAAELDLNGQNQTVSQLKNASEQGISLNGGTLTINNDNNALGIVKLGDNEQSTLNLTGKNEISSEGSLSGKGAVVIAGMGDQTDKTAELTLTAANENLSGIFRVENGVLSLKELAGLSGLGTSSVNLTDQGVLNLTFTQGGDAQFNNSVNSTAKGQFNVNLAGGTLSLGENFTQGKEDFQGSLQLTNTLFTLNDAQAKHLTRGTLILGSKSSTTVTGENANQLAGLEMKGGELNFTGSLNDKSATSIKTGQLSGEAGTINLTVEGLATGENSEETLNLSESDIFTKFGDTTLTFITADTNNALQEGVSILINGNAYQDDESTSTSKVTQNGIYNANISFGYSIDKMKGLSLTAGAVTQLELLGKADKAFTMMAQKDESFTAKITGKGDLKLGSTSGILTLGNNTNDYTGNTTITGGTVKAGAHNVFGTEGDLTLAENATVDLNGKAQSANKLDNKGTVTIGENGQLTIDTLNNTDKGKIDLADGTLTINQGSQLTGLVGSGALILANGESTVTTVNDLSADVKIQENATLNLNQENGIGLGEFNIAGGTLNLGAEGQTVSNKLSGSGAINVKESATVTNENNDFAGTFTVDNEKVLSVDKVAALGVGKIVLTDKDSALNVADESVDATLTNVLSGKGQVNVQENLTLAEGTDNSGFEGQFNVTDKKALSVNKVGALGAGKIELTGTASALNVADKDATLANVLSGQGQVNVQENLTLAKDTDNSGFEGQFIVTDKKALSVNKVGALGAGKIELTGTNSVLNVADESEDATLANVLSGQGQVNVQENLTLAKGTDNSGFEGQFIVTDKKALSVNKVGALGAGKIELTGTDSALNVADESEDATLANVLSGQGQVNVQESLTLAKDTDNSGFEGQFIVTDKKALSVNKVGALGAGKIELTGTNSVLNVADESEDATLANVLSGQGKVNVQENLTLAKGTDNSGFEGQFIVTDGKSLTVADKTSFGGTSAVNLGDQSQFNMNYAMGNLSANINGTGQLNLGEKASMIVSSETKAIADTVKIDLAKGATFTNKANTFNHELTGSGLLNIDVGGKENKFTFGDNVGNAFAGTVHMTNSQFELASSNKELNKATLQIGEGNSTTVTGENANQLANLEMKGGELNFTGSLNDGSATSITTGQLSGEAGTINLTVDGLAAGENSEETLNLSESDIFTKFGDTTLTFITADTNNALQEGVSILINGKAYQDDSTSTSKVTQQVDGEAVHNANISFGYGIDKTKGLSLTAGAVTELELLGKGEQAFTMMAQKDESFTALITGTGDLKLGAKEGQTLTLGQSDIKNDYTGNTTVTGGTVKAAADNIFGTEGDLTLAENATVDLNGKAQSANKLDNKGTVTIGENGQLTIDTLNNTDKGKIDLAKGTLTINKDSQLTGLTGSGALVIAGGISTVGTEANNQDLTANVKVQEKAILNLNQANGIGLGELNIAGGTLNLGAKNQTVNNKLSGNGAINVKEDATIANENNKDFTGTFTVDNEKILSVNKVGALGAGKIVLTDKDSALNVADESVDATLANALSGKGQVNVQENLTLAVKEGANNEAFTGQFNVTDEKSLTVNDRASFGGTSKVDLQGKDAQFNMNYEMGNLLADINGKGQLNLGENASMIVSAETKAIADAVRIDLAKGATFTNNAHTFNHGLTGSGLLYIDAGNKVFTFGENVGDAFAGTVHMTNSQFELASGNEQLNNATLQVGQGNSTTVKDQGNTLAGLEMKGGELNFTGSLNDGKATSIKTGQLSGEAGTINLTVDGLAVGEDSEETLNLSDSDIFTKFDGTTLTFISTSDALNEGVSILINGNAYQDNATSVSKVTQNDIYNANISFGYGIDKSNGLSLTAGAVTQLELIGKDSNAFTMMAQKDESFTALITGTGDLKLGAKEGQTLTLGQSDIKNDYTGNTTVTGGTVKAAADNIFGTEGDLTLAENATVDLNGKAQSANKLDNKGTVTIGENGQLTIDTLNNTDKGKIDLAKGTLTINKDSQLTGLTGSGALVIAGGISTVGTEANNKGLEANIAINKDATLNLNQENGIGLGDFTIAGALNLGADGQTVSNKLSGNGAINIQENATVANENNDFAGTFTVDNEKILSVNKVGALGAGKIELTGTDSALNVADTSEDVTLANVLLGQGQVNVRENLTLAVKEGANNEAFTGQFNVTNEKSLTVNDRASFGGTSKVDLQGKDAQFNMNYTMNPLSANITGTGLLQIGDSGKLTVLADGNKIEDSVQMAIAEKGQVEYQKNEFNHKLTGDGTLTVNLEGNEDKAFIFGNNEKVGDQFKGTVNMTHSQFELASGNEQLNNATLQIGQGNSTTVTGEDANQLANLEMIGGELNFTGSLNDGKATSITTDQWKIVDKSTIHLTVDGIDPTVDPYSNEVELTDSSIFEKFNVGGEKGGQTLTFIKLNDDNASTQGDVSKLNIIVNGQSSEELTRQSTSKVTQQVDGKAVHNANISFGYNINANQGLTLTTGAVTEINLIGQANEAFTMIAEDNERFTALITGVGDLKLGAKEGQTLTLGKTNEYTGNTIVTGGTVKAGANNVFGSKGDLTLTENATVDLNGQSQIIDELKNAGSLNMNDGTLTVNKGSQLTGLTGGGALVIAGGISTVDVVNENLRAKVEINEGAELNLNKDKGIGLGDFNIAGILNLGAKDQTVSNKLSGGGVINVKESATVAHENNKDFTGTFTVDNDKILLVNKVGALGKGNIILLGDNSALNVADKDATLANVLSGQGQVNVQENLALAKGTDNSGFAGQFNVTNEKSLTVNDGASFGGTSKVDLQGKDAQFNMNYAMGNLSADINGKGQLKLGENASMIVSSETKAIAEAVKIDLAKGATFTNKANTFNHGLTGSGLLNIDAGGIDQAFTFGDNVGNAFAGTVHMTNSQFELASSNKELNNATLQIGEGNSTTVKDQGNTLAGLEMKGGELNLDKPFVSSEDDKASIILDGALNLANGTLNLHVDGLGQGDAGNELGESINAEEIDLFALGSGTNSDVTFITADTVDYNKENMTVMLNGQEIELNGEGGNSSRTQLQQDNEYVADLVYSSNAVTTSSGGDAGLFITSGLTLIDLQEDKTLKLVNNSSQSGDFTTLVVGEGNLSLSGNMGFGHNGNSYTGDTSIVGKSDVTLLHDNAFGKEGGLIVGEEAKVNLNGKVQVVDKLENSGLVVIGKNEQGQGKLSVDTLHNAVDDNGGLVGQVNLRGGQLTIRNENDATSELTGLTGSGSLILVGGTSRVTGLNNGLTADVEIQENATVDLAKRSGLGTGDVTVAGKLQLTAKDQKVENKLTGDGFIEVRENASLVANNLGFTGTIAINNGAELNITNLNQLGRGEGQKALELTGQLNLKGIDGELKQYVAGTGTIKLEDNSDLRFNQVNKDFTGVVELSKSNLTVGVDGALGSAKGLEIGADSQFNLNGTTQTVDKVQILNGVSFSQAGKFMGTGDLVANEIINHGILQVGTSQLDLNDSQLLTGRNTQNKGVTKNQSTDHLIIRGDVQNHNLIQVAGNVPGNRLTIEGDYIGNKGASILMNVARMSDDQILSDELVIKGMAKGETTNVFVREVQPLGDLKRDRIALIRTEGSQEDSFVLGNAVLSGRYQYKLTLDNTDWYLERDGYRSDIGNNLANMGVAVQYQVPGFGGSILTGSSISGTGGLRSLGRSYVTGTVAKDGELSEWNIWNVTTGGKYKDREAAKGITYDSTYYGTTFGGERYIQLDDYVIQIGAMFTMLKAKNESYNNDSDIDGSSIGRLSGRIYSLYGTWYLDPNKGALSPYIDGVLSYGRYHNKIETEGNPEDRYNSHIWSVTVQAGYPFDLNNNLVIEPQMQLTYLNYNSSDYTDSNGNYISQKLKGNVISKVGAYIYPKEGNIRPYGGVNIWYDSTKGSITHDDEFTNGTRTGLMLELKAGVSATLNEGLNISADAYYRKGKGKANDYGIGLHLKYRLKDD